jgi:hypothetical protein
MNKVLEDAIKEKKKNNLLSKALKECEILKKQLQKQTLTQAQIIAELETKNGLETVE